MQAFSQAAGAACFDDLTCGEGLLCNVTSTNPITTCMKAGTSSSKKSCNTDNGEINSACDAGEYCECDYNKGGTNGLCIRQDYGNPSGIKNHYSDVMKCLLQCARTDDPCIAKNCHSQTCKAVSAVSSDNAELAIFPKCYVNAYNKVKGPAYELYGYFTCSDGAFLQYSLMLAVLSLFALLL